MKAMIATTDLELRPRKYDLRYYKLNCITFNLKQLVLDCIYTDAFSCRIVRRGESCGLDFFIFGQFLEQLALKK
jgi:hypothetical protein